MVELKFLVLLNVTIFYKDFIKSFEDLLYWGMGIFLHLYWSDTSISMFFLYSYPMYKVRNRLAAKDCQEHKDRTQKVTNGKPV